MLWFVKHFHAPYKAVGGCDEEGAYIQSVSRWFYRVLVAYLPILK